MLIRVIIIIIHANPYRVESRYLVAGKLYHDIYRCRILKRRKVKSLFTT
jgi:hypothetical protein